MTWTENEQLVIEKGIMNRSVSERGKTLVNYELHIRNFHPQALF